MKLAMLKILVENGELSQETKDILSGIFTEVPGVEMLNDEQCARVRELLESEIRVNTALADAYGEIEHGLRDLEQFLKDEE